MFFFLVSVTADENLDNINVIYSYFIHFYLLFVLVNSLDEWLTLLTAVLEQFTVKAQPALFGGGGGGEP